ncbi:Fic family protein [Calothrix parasitica NIES-267]|uniref:Fic family protein n=1 Tax=Calothrix parasitica NIES-267 TaxID=1973488 RepID=A0A1Z4LNT1_9CYAN|nr:Fic family protein [Calothrix parasitica NIES-267]
MVDKNRAGCYVQQAGGYKAFIPSSLPPKPEINMDMEMWNLLSQADRALGRLDGSTDALPNPDLNEMFLFLVHIENISRVKNQSFTPRQYPCQGSIFNLRFDEFRKNLI